MDDVVQVPLTRGYVALIDAADADEVLAHRWSAHQSNANVYARRQVRVEGRMAYIWLHRFLMQAPGNMQVDHINLDSLDCRRANMRLATQAQNSQNQRKRKTSAAPYKGVTFADGRYCVRIQYDGTRKYLGRFGNAEDAARAYDAVAREQFGEFARLNFPDERRQ